MMRIFKFDYLFLLLITLSFMGCGDGGKRGVAGFSSNAQLTEVRNLTSEERIIATRVCYAYQSKNTNFKSQTYFYGKFTFDITSKNCSGTNSSYKISSTLNQVADLLTYVTTDTREFQKSVQTNQTGFLAQLCSKIQNNEPISNTVSTPGNKVQIRFFKDSMDGYAISYFKQKGTGNGATFIIDSTETFKVRTQFNISANQILGMDESFTRQQICLTQAVPFSNFSQIFNSFSAQ